MSPHMPDRGSVLTPAAGSLDHEMRWPRTRLGYCWRMDFDASTLRDRRLERPVRGGGFLPNPRISSIVHLTRNRRNGSSRNLPLD
jgi:hypothetical protein